MSKIYMTIGIVVLAASLGFVSYLIWGPDNPVEEECEKVIHDTTGASVDLTPTTPETPTE